jgi:SAM-dependent methyltransferase
MIKCRFCFSENLFSIIPLGKLPLANALTSALNFNKEINSEYNLEVMLCKECGLAQLKDLVEPKKLFSDYVYFTSNSDAMLLSVAELSKRIIPTLPENAFVVEIASNDGYLLKNYIKAGISVLGIDPAINVAKFANEKGIPTLCDFFNEALAADLSKNKQKADIIHANNVMAHIPDIPDFIRGLKLLLKDNGKIIIEVPYFLDLVEKFEFDTIYHEHIYYFSVKPLKRMFNQSGLDITNIEKITLHGGSLRITIMHSGKQVPEPIVELMIKNEIDSGLYFVENYKDFMKKIIELKNSLNILLKKLKSNGDKIAVYGASAKGTTLLNYFGIGQEIIEFVVDKSHIKHGKFTPGTNLQIFSPSRLIDENISYALLLAWNFVDEIVSQQKEFIDKGGKFIIPLPQVGFIP